MNYLLICLNRQSDLSKIYTIVEVLAHCPDTLLVDRLPISHFLDALKRESVLEIRATSVIIIRQDNRQTVIILTNQTMDVNSSRALGESLPPGEPQLK